MLKISENIAAIYEIIFFMYVSISILLKLGYVTKYLNHLKYLVKQKLYVCQVVVDTVVAIYLWSC